MILQPSGYSSRPAYELLDAAAHGFVGADRRWLHALVDDPQTSLPGIAAFAAEDRSQDRIPLAADLVAIFRYLKSPLGLPYLTGLVRLEPSDIPDELMEAFVAIGAPAIEPLLQLYSELKPEDRNDVAFLLAGLGVRDPRILDLLLKRLDEGAENALFDLEVFRDPAAIPELSKRLEDATAERRRDIEDTIGDLQKELESGADNPATKDEFDLWDPYPDEEPPQYEVLTEEERIEFLASPSEQQRADAAASFFGGEFSLPAREKLLNLARADPDANVRARAWEVFEASADDPELRRIMFARLKDPSTPSVEKAGLIVALSSFSDQSPVRAAILDLAKDPATRAKSVEAMWRSMNEDFAPAAVKYLDDADPEVIRNAIWAVGYLGITDAAARLPPHFDDPRLRPDALHNYAMAAPAAPIRKKMRELFHKIDDLAHGLDPDERDLVVAGIRNRMMHAGVEEEFSLDDVEEAEEPVRAAKTGRNDPCPCGSGKKYKKCCGK